MVLEKQTEEVINHVTEKPEKLCVTSLHCLEGSLQFVGLKYQYQLLSVKELESRLNCCFVFVLKSLGFILFFVTGN